MTQSDKQKIKGTEIFDILNNNGIIYSNILKNKTMLRYISNKNKQTKSQKYIIYSPRLTS